MDVHHDAEAQARQSQPKSTFLAHHACLASQGEIKLMLLLRLLRLGDTVGFCMKNKRKEMQMSRLGG